MESTIKTLEDTLRASVIYFMGNWDKYLPLVEFSYNNGYHSATSIARSEDLYGRRCRSPTVWLEVGEYSFLVPKLIYKKLEKVNLFRNNLI